MVYVIGLIPVTPRRDVRRMLDLERYIPIILFLSNLVTVHFTRINIFYLLQRDAQSKDPARAPSSKLEKI